MDPSQTPSAMTLLAGPLLAAGFAFIAVLAASTSAGCSSQETTSAPDSGVAPCDPGPFVFCQPVEADQPHCYTDDGTSPILSHLRRDTRYPVGCVIDLVGPRDLQGDCRLESVCKCVIGDLPTTPTPQPEAGAPEDAGADADSDAAPPPPPPPPVDAGPPVPPVPTVGPIWQCG